MKITNPKRPATLALYINAGGVTVSDPGGYFGGGPLTLEDVLALIGAGSSPDSFLRTTLGGLDIVQALGTLGATETIDLANANWFWGTLDQDCAITTVGWTNLRGATVHIEIIGDGTSLPTIDGVTWIGDAPGIVGSGDVLHAILFSRDGGTTIYGAVVGGSSSSSSLVWRPVMVEDPVSGDWLVVVTGDGDAVMVEA